jgi:AraC-like DNA-binding protein
LSSSRATGVIVTHRLDLSERLRLEWACDVLNVYQRVVGLAMEGNPTNVDAIAAHIQLGIPQPTNRAEWIHLLQSLTHFLDRIGDVIHATYHRRFSTASCASLFMRAAPETEGINLEASVLALPIRWASDYAAWFTHHHTLPVALRTKLVIDKAFAQPLTIPYLAETIGCSRTTLIDQFTAAFGLPPAEYLARVRIREGLQRLRQHGEAVERAAADVGYRSGNKFYARMRRYTNLTPSQVRELSEKLLEDRISLRLQRRERRHVVGADTASWAADRRRAERRTARPERRVSDRRGQL